VNRLTIDHNFNLTINYDSTRFAIGYPALAE